MPEPVDTRAGNSPPHGDTAVAEAGADRRWPLGTRLPDWRPRDPGRSALRRAARAAIVAPVVLAFTQFDIRNAQVVTFAAFGCFALLVMADFSGRRSPRAAAYVTTTLVGAALIALGTLASASPWVGALGMLLIGFALSFVGVLGGYVAAAQPALLLAFVLSVAVPAPPSAIPSRLLGWGIAGAVSTVASVLLWPRFERSTLRSQAASACGALVALIRARRMRPEPPDLAQLVQAAQATVEAVRGAYAATPNRPASPALRDRAFVALLSELDRILTYVTRPTVWSLSAQHPCLLEGDALANAVAQTLEASGQLLTGGAPPDLVALQEARRAHRSALNRWASDALQAGSPPEEVLAGFEADDPLRVVALLVLALGADALVATGRSLPPELRLPLTIPSESGALPALRRIGQTLRTYLYPTSSVLHNSLRVAVGLALAVLLGGVLQLSHAFWVVLGTMSALRSSALATGRTTVQALVGTIIGVAIGVPFIYAVGRDTAILWILLPFVVFFAAYAATVVGFVASQAAFTFFVIMLFNLLAPSGWSVGLVRLEDVAIGVGVGLLVGLLLWPRGLRGELRHALADLYRAVAGDLTAAFNQILDLGTSQAFALTHGEAVRSAEREGEAFDQYVRERGSQPLAPQMAGSLGAAGRNAMMAADVLHTLADAGYHLRDPRDADAALIGEARALAGIFTQLADQLDGGTSAHANARSSEQQVNDQVLRMAVLGYLRRWKEDPTADHAAIAVVTASEWMRNLATLAAELKAPVARVVEAAQVPWWR